MNYVFKTLVLMLVLNQNLAARELILITYGLESQRELAQSTHRILTQDIGVPASFINIQFRSRPCEKQTDSIAHFCFDQDDQMWPVNFNEEIALKSLQVFMKSEEG